jgi:hypothetical protein
MKTKKGPKTPEQKLRLGSIEQALKNGYRLIGFSLGNGLRVINIQKDGELKAYGESVEVLGALENANEDYARGHRPYKYVYGVKKPRHLTGQLDVSCHLDRIVRFGEEFEIHFENGLFVARYQTVEFMVIEPPLYIRRRFLANKTKEPEIYERYGHTYKAKPPLGDSSWCISIIGRPKGRHSSSGVAFDVAYTGEGYNIGAAIHNMLTNTGKAKAIITQAVLPSMRLTLVRVPI